MPKFSVLILIALLAACNLPSLGTDLATAPATEAPYQPCAYQWATQSLPKLSAQVQMAMQSAGLNDVTAIAEAYGETCSTGLPGQPASFSAMETDFKVTLKVVSLTDKDDLGNLLEKVLTVLDKFPVGSTPGPQPGYMGVTFEAGNEDLNLWFHAADGKAALDQGLRGAALLDQFLNK